MHSMEWLKTFINEVCIIRREPGDLLPGSEKGHFYKWCFYLRRGLYYPEFLKTVTSFLAPLILEKLKHTNFQLCGMESAGVPIITGLSLEFLSHDLTIPVFSLRKEQKAYALMQWHEGIIYPDKEVVLIDDLCNSTTSLKKCYDYCTAQKLKVSNTAFTIVNKVNLGMHDKERESSDRYLPKNIEVHSLFTLSDFGCYDNTTWDPNQPMISKKMHI